MRARAWLLALAPIVLAARRDARPEMLGGGDVEPDYGPAADEYPWLTGADDPDRPSRWRDGDEATRADDDQYEGSDEA